MAQRTIYLDEGTDEELARAAAQLDVSASKVASWAIRRYLESFFSGEHSTDRMDILTVKRPVRPNKLSTVKEG